MVRGMMACRAFAFLPALACAVASAAAPAYQDLDSPAHGYHTSELHDRFSLLKTDLESGRIALDATSERAFVLDLLKVLGVPASSQMLVFSNTSLQLHLISPANPRALYFSEDVHVGYIPGGRIEILSLDPSLGAIFYIFDIPRAGQPVRPERSERCMNCHAAADTQFVPGLVIKSVVPGRTGGSLDAFRQEKTGHGIPFEQRFGGWYVTGKSGIAMPWANGIGQFAAQGMMKQTVEPGSRYDWARYPVATSDVLAHLLHEHQAGFVNRVVEASYRARAALHAGAGQLDAAQQAELDEQARIVTRYLLFADEVPLPAGGVEGDPAFKADFARNRHAAKNGASLKDFDLQSRLFRNRCSYMIYSAVFHGLPAEMKMRIFQRLGAALDTTKPDPDYAYLPAGEKQSIRRILRETLADLPAGW
jgi:hypothetical protein